MAAVFWLRRKSLIGRRVKYQQVAEADDALVSRFRLVPAQLISTGRYLAVVIPGVEFLQDTLIHVDAAIPSTRMLMTRLLLFCNYL
jgi:hypothetical protein